MWEQDRDGVIATVEDARAAQESEADRLRHLLEGSGKLPPTRAGANGTVVAPANGSTSGGDADNAAGGYRDELAVSAEVRQVSGVRGARLNDANRRKRQLLCTFLLVKWSKRREEENGVAKTVGWDFWTKLREEI